MPPSGTPVSEQVVDAVVALFEGITAGSDYYTEVRKVVKYEPQVLRLTADRLVAVKPEGSDFENGRLRNVGEWQTSMDLRLFLVVKTSTNTVDEVLRFERDALKAILDDQTVADGALGGLAVKTDVLNSSYQIPDDRDAEAYAELLMRVHFRTPRTDLNTAT